MRVEKVEGKGGEEKRGILLLKALSLYLHSSLSKIECVKDSLWTLMHYSFRHENRERVAQLGIVETVLKLMQDYSKEAELIKLALSLLWNLSCNLNLRKKMKEQTNILHIVSSFLSLFLFSFFPISLPLFILSYLSSSFSLTFFIYSF